jgi:hypothetical protein
VALPDWTCLSLAAFASSAVNQFFTLQQRRSASDKRAAILITP